MKPLRPAHDGKFRARPRDGKPTCVLEAAAQFMWRNRLRLWVFAVTTATFFLVLFDVHLR